MGGGAPLILAVLGAIQGAGHDDYGHALWAGAHSAA